MDIRNHLEKHLIYAIDNKIRYFGWIVSENKEKCFKMVKNDCFAQLLEDVKENYDEQLRHKENENVKITSYLASNNLEYILEMFKEL